MSNYAKEFMVKPGKEVRLKDVRPDYHGAHETDNKSALEVSRHLAKMNEKQYLMYAEHRHSLLIIFQGLDAAGKDGVIRHVMTGMNPQGCAVTGFKQPTSEEVDHEFLWRVHGHCPGKGAVAIFNRSDYEDVLITKVHGKISEKECQRRFRLINDFERLLTNENETKILKFFLHISKGEQLDRFGDRLKDPARRWKISEGDYKERDYWRGYMKAYEHLLGQTSTECAPWFIIPSNHKWFRNLAVSQIIANTLEDLKMQLPKATVNIAQIRRKYHADRQDS